MTVGLGEVSPHLQGLGHTPTQCVLVNVQIETHYHCHQKGPVGR
jgi:hypothetical protein